MELVAARADGTVLVQRTPSGATLDRHAALLWDFSGRSQAGAMAERPQAAMVFSGSPGGAITTRLDPHLCSADGFRARLETLLRDQQLFVERLVIV